MKRLTVFFVVMTLTAFVSRAADNGESAAKPPEFSPEVAGVLDHAKSAVLYSLEPADIAKERDAQIGGFKILGKAVLDEKQTAQAAHEFRAVIIPRDNTFAMCFQPRHALRIESGGHRYDFVLCYECEDLSILKDGVKIDDFRVKGSPAALNAMLKALNVPLAFDSDAKNVKELQKANVKRAKKEAEQWLKLMPAPLQPVWTEHGMFDAVDNGDFSNIEFLKPALEKAEPDKIKRILILLDWAGKTSTDGLHWEWHENVPQLMLLEYSVDDITSTVLGGKLTGSQLDGAAVLFGGWVMEQKRPGTKAHISPELKKVLRDHLLQSTDMPTREWAEKEFGEKATPE